MTRLWQLGMAVVLVTGLAGCGVAVDQRSLQTTATVSPQVTASETSPVSSAVSSPEPSSETPSATIVRIPSKAADTNLDSVVVTAETKNAETDTEVEIASLAPSAAASIDDLLTTTRPADENSPAGTAPAAPRVSEPAPKPATGDGATIAGIVPPAPKAAAAAPAPQVDAKTEDDVVGDIIWNLESAKRAGPAPPAEPKIPVGPDPSLASDALEAAFAQIARRDLSLPEDVFVLPKKAPSMTRIALLIPVTGPNAALGAELQNGAELALFSVRNQNIELVVFDTHAEGADMAASQAVVAQADIMVGPLFSEAVVSARKIARQANIPMLALSNNLKIADQGSWLLGYVPEQQVDALLGYALTNGHNRVGIIAEDAPFGQILARHAVDRLAQFGLRPEDRLTLTSAMLADEDQLKSAIRSFTGYKAPGEDEKAPAFSDLPPSRFDALIFAGSADFALRTAPVLAYYDADSERVLYLGNAQWNQQRILTEPSLQGGVFASRPTGRDEIFNGLWSEVWTSRPGALARLSFDAMAMATVLTAQQRQLWQAALESKSGFSGFSGAYRLLPGGGNLRAFELRQIQGGVSAILQPAPDKI